MFYQNKLQTEDNQRNKRKRKINKKQEIINQKLEINHKEKQKQRENTKQQEVEQEEVEEQRNQVELFFKMMKEINEKQYKSKNEVIMNKIRKAVKSRQEQTEPEKVSVQKAVLHSLATQVGRDKKEEELMPGEKITYCECCARQIQKKEQNMNCTPIELAFLGSAYVSYLEFIKFTTKLLLSFLLSSGLFNIITNSAFGEDCLPPHLLEEKELTDEKSECMKNWVTQYSIGNKRSKESLMKAQSFFNLISILICIWLFQRFRFQLRKIEQSCDESEVQASDYALLISYLPDEFTYEGDVETLDYAEIIKKFLHLNLAQKESLSNQNKRNENKKADEKDNHELEKQNQIKEMKMEKYKENNHNNQEIKIQIEEEDPQKDYIEIVSVGLCYDLKKYGEIDTHLQQIQKKLATSKRENEKIKLKDVIANLKKQKEEFPKKYVSTGLNRYKIENFTGYAYVILQYEEDQERVQDFYKEIEFITSLIIGQKTQSLTFEGNQIAISAAPDPNNIFWENLRHSYSALMVRRTALFIATLLLLGGCLGLLFSFQLIQMKVGASENKDSPVVIIMSYSISVSIILLNAGVQFSIFLIASKEARSTKAGFFDSVVVKHAVAHFLNTSVLLFIIQVFIYTDGDGYGKLFKAGGLAYNMNSIFMTNMIVSNVMQFVNIPYILAKSMQSGFKKLENSEKLQKIAPTQAGLNQYFENPIFNLQQQYSIIISSIFSALFYAPILPFCLIWTMIQLFLKYWVDKKSTMNVGANVNACLDVLENLEYCLPIYSLSNLIFFVYISPTNQIDQISILGVLVGIVHAILPMQFFNEKFYKLEDNVNNTERYEDVNIDFITDYDRENPIKREEAMKRHYKALKNKAKKENKLDLGNSIYDLCLSTSGTPKNAQKQANINYGLSKFGMNQTQQTEQFEEQEGQKNDYDDGLEDKKQEQNENNNLEHILQDEGLLQQDNEENNKSNEINLENNKHHNNNSNKNKKEHTPNQQKLKNNEPNREKKQSQKSQFDDSPKRKHTFASFMEQALIEMGEKQRSTNYKQDKSGEDDKEQSDFNYYNELNNNKMNNEQEGKNYLNQSSNNHLSNFISPIGSNMNQNYFSKLQQQGFDLSKNNSCAAICKNCGCQNLIQQDMLQNNSSLLNQQIIENVLINKQNNDVFPNGLSELINNHIINNTSSLIKNLCQYEVLNSLRQNTQQSNNLNYQDTHQDIINNNNSPILRQKYSPILSSQQSQQLFQKNQPLLFERLSSSPTSNIMQKDNEYYIQKKRELDEYENIIKQQMKQLSERRQSQDDYHKNSNKQKKSQNTKSKLFNNSFVTSKLSEDDIGSSPKSIHHNRSQTSSNKNNKKNNNKMQDGYSPINNKKQLFNQHQNALSEQKYTEEIQYIKQNNTQQESPQEVPFISNISEFDSFQI